MKRNSPAATRTPRTTVWKSWRPSRGSYTDSQYLRHAVEKKWLAGWRKNGWKTAAKKPVKNRDLWERLQVQLDRHSVTLEWVRGHNGHADNERCDELARSQSARHDLPEDTGYEPE